MEGNAREAYYNLPIRSDNLSTNLPLQMCLYFNVLYYPLWLIIEIVMLVIKFEKLSSFYQVIIICILVCMSINEVGRLYLGYLGNLSEKMPELAAHWILTTVIQLPLLLFLLINEATFISPLERIVCSFMLVFLALEVVFGFQAMRNTVRFLMRRFRADRFSRVDLNPTRSVVGHDNLMFKDD